MLSLLLHLLCGNVLFYYFFASSFFIATHEVGRYISHFSMSIYSEYRTLLGFVGLFVLLSHSELTSGLLIQYIHGTLIKQQFKTKALM